MEKICEFQKIIDESKKIVFFGGAGVSTESGIPDFRSQNGLYNQKWKFPPETIISHSFFEKNPKEFYRFYCEKLLFDKNKIKPNITHLTLAKMEKQKKLLGIVTQNIDGLHQEAGNKNVFEIHGSIHRNYCTKCNDFYDDNFIRQSQILPEKLPICKNCGGLVKPDVILYEESLNDNILDGAIKLISSADLLIIGGTSLSVYPAAGLIQYFRGKNVVIINRDETPSDNFANLVIHKNLGEVFEKITV